jgi:uronate dehydrogenase
MKRAGAAPALFACPARSRPQGNPDLPTPQRILVTGSAGRLGQAAVRELQRQGHHIRGIDLRPTPGLADAIIDSLRDPRLLLEATAGVDAVIHLAATPDDPAWPPPPRGADNFLSELIPNNLVPLYHVLEASRRSGVPRIVLASSGQVVWDQSFDGPFPIGAGARPTPRWWYACTKLFLEAIGRAYAKQGHFSVVAVRLGFCPRDLQQEEEIEALERNQDVYLSPGDAGRFFCRAALAPRPRGSFDLVYATSIPKHQERFDLAPARRKLGYVPQDLWPQGAEFLPRAGRKRRAPGHSPPHTGKGEVGGRRKPASRARS